ncbi:MAG: Multiple EGF-like-domain protein 3 precursor [Myxococcales bacterium]|nr:Multiple EGF-like-domain protein 3 precursor [Myxococcales bacterium]
MRTHWTVALVLLSVVGCSSKVNGVDLGGGVGGNGADDMGVTCGNGVVDTGEDCDNGADNGVAGGSCNQFCQFACAVDINCDDANACNGAEKCVGHACTAGTAPDDGTTCGSGKLCRGGTCVASKCGDGIVTAPEECDDGNVTAGDGCENDCKFSCVSTDASRKCAPADTCAGQGSCNDTTHVCAPGTPLGDGTMCGAMPNNYCKGGKCTTPMCGNGTKEPGEDCDDGGLNGTKGSGCKIDCTFACVTPATDCGAPDPCEKYTCSTAHICTQVPDTSKNGMSCPGGASYVCKDGSCAPPTSTCGNGVVETGEDCDFGTANNGPNTGCEANCKLSCANAAACADGNACNGTESCDAVTVGTGSGKKCNPGTPQADGTTCSAGKICLNKVCQNSTCGDGYVDGGKGETCEPPNTASCDASCHSIVCGDGVRAGSEQCDDGLTSNLDGCSATCKFEQVQRANSLKMSWDTAICNPNALGTAIVNGTAQGQLQTTIDAGVKDGSMTVILSFFGLDDLTGTKSTAPFSVGTLHGSPDAGAAYDGTNDLDWWYPTDAVSIDAATRLPKNLLPNGAFASGKFTAGPGTLTLNLVLAGSPAALTMYDARFSATSNAASAPLMSSGATPGHLASEHLDPALKSFAGLSGGKLCGNVSAASLKAVAAPMAIQTNCDEGYTAANTLLDAIVNGCTKTVFFVPITVIKATQPDKSTDGNTYKLTKTGKSVTGCTGGVAWPDCLDKAAYSSGFQFTSDRVISK